jgi:hypothetical protein
MQRLSPDEVPRLKISALTDTGSFAARSTAESNLSWTISRCFPRLPRHSRSIEPIPDEMVHPLEVIAV